VDRENSLGEPIGSSAYALAYRVRAVALLIFAAISVYCMLTPESAPSGAVAELSAPPDSGERVFEEVRTGLRDITPPAVHRPPKPQQQLVERLPALRPAKKERKKKPDKWARPQIPAAGILESQGTRIAIAGVAPLPPGTLCADAGGSDWPCGNQARTAMRRLIRLRTVACDPVEREGANGGLITRCEISGHDIGAWLVAQGWATALPGSGYEELESQAREKGLGQWTHLHPSLASR
jgi:endonuclease YncB( thermonuclease family)